MRAQKSLWLLLALNIVLAGAHLRYLLVSGPPSPSPAPATEGTSLNDSASRQANERSGSSRKFNWQEVESEAYPEYLEHLRAAGCPEERVRQIVMRDVEELFAHKRLQIALAFDTEWWREEPMGNAVEFLQKRGEALEEEREELTVKLLGDSKVRSAGEWVKYWSHIQLTGLVLGSLPAGIHERVQEICARSSEEQERVLWRNAGEESVERGLAVPAPFNEHAWSRHVEEQSVIPVVEIARLREQARAELQKVLTAEQTEEFLLRYSRTAQELREDLRRFGPTAEEFRKLFRALDPLQRGLELQYGGEEALSKSELERHQQAREATFREVLSPERYRAYLLSQQRLSMQVNNKAQGSRWIPQ